MNNNKIFMDNKITSIVVALLIAAASFYGGTLYGKSSVGAAANQARGGANWQRGVSGQVQFPGQGGQANRNRGGMSAGEIIKMDDKSLTLKMNDGGSKIVYFGASTTVSKMAEGNNSDLSIGKNVMIIGKTSQDGSIVAESVQIRPAMQGGNQGK